MSDSDQATILFLYHLAWGAAVSIVVSLFVAHGVSKQQLVTRDIYNNEQVSTRVNRPEYLKTWGLYSASGTAAWLVVLLVWLLRSTLKAGGYIS